MDYKRIDSFDALSNNQENAQPGRVHGVVLQFNGTNASATTNGFGDLGSIIIRRNDDQIWNVDMGVLANFIDIRFGANFLSSVSAGDFVAQTFVPFFESGLEDEPFNNALLIQDESELNLEWIPDPNASSNFDSLDVDLFAELAAYPEKYVYRGLRNNQNENGAVNSKPYQMNRDNISGLFITDPDSVIDLLQLEQNNRTVLSPSPFDMLQGVTIRNNRIEASTFPMVELQTYSKGNPPTTVNQNTVLAVTTTGAGDIPIFHTSLDWHEEPIT